MAFVIIVYSVKLVKFPECMEFKKSSDMSPGCIEVQSL